MPLATWPAGLPYQPRRDAFSAEPHHVPAVVSEFEDGPDVARLQSYTRIKEVNYSLPFSDAQLATFEAFAEGELKQTTAHFLMPVRFAGSAAYVTRRCFIKGAKWTSQPNGAEWTVAFVNCVFVAEP